MYVCIACVFDTIRGSREKALTFNQKEKSKKLGSQIRNITS